MQTEVVFAGFGGQGVLFSGQLLAYAGMDEGMDVTWMPSYGPEMRGGTANCTVIVADEEIGSPYVSKPKAAVVLNLPSMDKYEPLVIEGGVLIANQSLINRQFQRTDLDAILVPANEIAEIIGNRRLINMVMLGALMQKLTVLPIEAIQKALDDHLPERHRKLLGANKDALQKGAAFARGEYVAEDIVHA
jgi:2-oxoglutarate ferredoxin oxidoreductase subunit gamma